METVLSRAIVECGGAANGGTSAAAGGSDMFSTLAWIGLVGFVAVLLTGVGLALALLLASRRSRRAPALVPIPVNASASPDGYYWWDGSAWRPRL